MAGLSSKVHPTIEYWDVVEKRYRFWEPTQDLEKNCWCKEGHTYPDVIVHALVYEKLKLIGEKECLEECLRCAHREIDWLRGYHSQKELGSRNKENTQGNSSRDRWTNFRKRG